MIDQAIKHARTNGQQYLSDLFELLRIPSISTLPGNKKDVLKAANWLTSHMESIGLENVQLVKTPSNPIVYGDWLHAKGKPTVLIYGHYDVQPADPLDEWKSPPFEPTIRGNRLYGRGTSDNKCQHFIFLSAVASYLKTQKRLPVNIKFAIEGAEETGSDYFDSALTKNKQLFSHDVSIIADLGMAGKDKPAIFYGLRGILFTEVTVQGPAKDLHSGVYGGVVDNPANVLTRILGKLQDRSGKVAIPNFYNNVASISEEEKRLLRQSARNAAELKQLTGAKELIKLLGSELFLQRKTLPTLDINGIYSGFTGEGSKTIIPSTASAKISMRLVPNQDPDEVFIAYKNFIRKHTPHTVSINVVKLASEPALISDFKGPEISSAKKAMEKVFSGKTVLNRSGASIPAAAHLAKVYKKPLIMTGFSLLDSNIHSPNENFYLPNFAKGIEAAIHMFSNLA